MHCLPPYNIYYSLIYCNSFCLFVPDFTLQSYRTEHPVLNEGVKASITVLKQALWFIVLQQFLGTADHEVLQTVGNAHNALFLVVITLLTNINTT